MFFEYLGTVDRKSCSCFEVRDEFYAIKRKYFHAVEFKQAALPHLADLVAVKQFELSVTFIVVILDGDAAVPFLDFTRASPNADVNWLGAVEHQACC